MVNKMGYDINNLLNLDYLNNTISQFENEVNALKKQLIELYDIEDLKKIGVNVIRELFLSYNLKCDALIQYLYSDFINKDWEFADLFADDIEYSNNLLEELKSDALRELAELNTAIDLNNQKNLNNIKKLEEDIFSLRKILGILDDSYFVVEEDVLWLHSFSSNLNVTDIELYRFSSEISKILIAKNKKILDNKAKEDELLFESSLDDVYGKAEIENQESIYFNEIRKYYDKYKNIFDDVNLGSDLEEIMILSNELVLGLDGINSYDDFCISLGSLFYKINAAEDESECEKLLQEVKKIDDFYIFQYSRLASILNIMDASIDKIKRLSKEEMDEEFSNKVILLYNSYKKRVSENIFNNTIYDEVLASVNMLNKTVNQVISLNKINNNIINLLNLTNSSLCKLTDSEYLELSTMQSDILCYIELVMQEGYNLEAEKAYNNYLIVMDKYKQDKKEEYDKINLSGFVLFDFDENGIPYVISDLDQHNRNNLIDGSILSGKCDSGFQDFSDLINDLLLYGVPRTLIGENNHSLCKVINPIYSDKNSRNITTGMVRIRPSRSSLVRFMSRECVLKHDTEIYSQVITLLKEILPGIDIDESKDFKLIVNFASSMKGSSEDSYRVCILRYDRHSPLYKLLFSDTTKAKLSENECSVLKDIIHMSLDAYFKLEKVNDKLSFSIIRTIGGENTYGK